VEQDGSSVGVVLEFKYDRRVCSHSNTRRGRFS
jgi:hypothetical protein